MSGELTPAEMSRAIRRLELNTVSKELYEANLRELREDIHDIKEAQTWAMRLIVSQFVVLVLAVILLLIQGAA